MTEPDLPLRPNWRVPDGICAAISTVTAPGNVAVHVGDDPAKVLLRRRHLQRSLQLPQAPKWLRQQHTTYAVRAEHSSAGVVADAIWSAQGEVCAVLTADCLPILLCSEDASVIAALHAGWRGLANGIITRTVAQLPVSPARLRAYIGPAITQPHFQVGSIVYDAFVAQGLADSRSFLPDGEDKWRADLPLLAERMLHRVGISHVTQSGLCTYSDERFYSYRRDPNCGRIATLIWNNKNHVPS